MIILPKESLSRNFTYACAAVPATPCCFIVVLLGILLLLLLLLLLPLIWVIPTRDLSRATASMLSSVCLAAVAAIIAMLRALVAAFARHKSILRRAVWWTCRCHIWKGPRDGLWSVINI